MAVEGFLGETFALHEQEVVEVGQNGTVEAYGVFHKQNHLHPTLPDVVLKIHLVFDELDDGENEVGIAQPTEHVVEDGEVFILHTAGDAVGKRREHHAVNVGEVGLNGAGHGERIVVGIAGHTDHQVHIGGFKHLGRLLGCRHLGERGRIAQAEFGVFVVYFFLHASVVFEHESVVGIGHDEHVVDAASHQVDERHVFQIKLVPLLWYFRFHGL